MSDRVSIEEGVPYPVDTEFGAGQTISGVYIIQNIFSDRCYVGATMDVARRWRSHYLDFMKGWHTNKCLQNEYLRDPQLFVFRLLEICHVSELRDREVYHVNAHEANSTEWGYNQRPLKYPNKVAERQLSKVS